MRVVKDFLTGAGYVFRGCSQFYGDRDAWKYCLLPVTLMLVFYILLYISVFAVTGILVDRAMGACERLPEYLSWLEVCIRAGIWLGSSVVFFLLLAAGKQGKQGNCTQNNCQNFFSISRPHRTTFRPLFRRRIQRLCGNKPWCPRNF